MKKFEKHEILHVPESIPNHVLGNLRIQDVYLRIGENLIIKEKNNQS